MVRHEKREYLKTDETKTKNESKKKRTHTNNRPNAPFLNDAAAAKTVFFFKYNTQQYLYAAIEISSLPSLPIISMPCA